MRSATVNAETLKGYSVLWLGGAIRMVDTGDFVRPEWNPDPREPRLRGNSIASCAGRLFV